MRSIVGVLLIIISFISYLFFLPHNLSTTILILCYVAFCALSLLGVLLIYSSLRNAKAIGEKHIQTEIQKLKSSAEKLELNFEKCSFKNGSFSYQEKDENLTDIVISAHILSSLPYIGTDVTENVNHSYLTYTETVDGKISKFISQSFPVDQTTLKFYVLNNSIVLYIDRFNREKYLFDLKDNNGVV